MTDFSAQPPAAPVKQSSRGPVLLGLVAGLVIAALIVAGLFLTDVAHFGDDEDDAVGVDTAAIVMPSKIGAFSLAVDEIERVSGKPETAAEQGERIAKRTEATAAGLTAAYSGAAAASQVYATEGLTSQPWATVVRAQSPAPFLASVVDPADLGLSVNRENLLTDGDVSCVIYYVETYPTGKLPADNDRRVQYCQRTGPALTVRVYGGGSGEDDVDQVKLYVDATNDLWNSIAQPVT